MTGDRAEGFARRFNELAQAGEQLFEKIRYSIPVDLQHRPECVSWIFSAANLLEIATPPESRYYREAQRLIPAADGIIYPDLVANILGVLKSAAAESSSGLLTRLEDHFVGLTFEQFLQHAAAYNERGKKMEAAVLASAVLEDTVKRLCQKHGIATDDKSLEPLINGLKVNGIVGRVKAERLKSYASLRNQAFHAQWDNFDDRDLRQMIEGLEELLDAAFQLDLPAD